MESNSGNVIIRSMRTADIGAIASIHCESFPNSRSTKLGELFVRKMYRWFVEKQPALAFVAVVDDQPAGFVTGAIGGSGRKIFRYAFPEILWGFLCHPGLFLNADMLEAWQSYLLGLLPKYRNTNQPASGNGTFVKAVLASIAVSPRVRGKNVGKSLVSAFENAARQQGATMLGLGVERDNTAARRFYESCGWVLMRENVEMNSANYVKEIRRA